ncbi:unnamed protein product, partial [Rotaria magnacalcarata]
MLTRRRSFLKYLVLIPTLWILTTLTLSFRSNSSSLPQSNNDIPINVVNQIVSAPSFVDRIRNALPFINQNPDNEH